MAVSNRDRVGSALDLLAGALEPFVASALAEEVPAGAEWTKLLEARDNEKSSSPRGGYNRGDLQCQLRAITERLLPQWFPFENLLARSEINLASELREVRNRWAHQNPFSYDDAYRALDTTERLLRAINAPEPADTVRSTRQVLQQEQFETGVKRATRAQTALPTLSSEGLPSWRSVLRPHPDVESGNYAKSEFAADLYTVAQNAGIAEYQDPVEFFRRTYVTEGLGDLLKLAARRVAGDSNAEPVINLQTNFGGGKTHSMLAVWHLCSGTDITDYPQQVQDAVDDTRVPSGVRRVALVGNEIPPGQPLPAKEDGTVVHTLWGELAWQLGKAEGYAMVEQADRTGTNPGSVLEDLLRRFGPAVILIDEWVAYARGLYGREDLTGGTFETQFTFAQTLTESVKRVPGILLLVSIPASDVRLGENGEEKDASDLEIGGANGRAALDRLQNAVGRLAYQWRPASSRESFEIVRRRLFQDPDADARTLIGATARRFVEFYREHIGEFPSETREVAYEQRIRDAYPIHPELFDRLYEDWSSLERFQRTRGVLRLMSAVVSSLWMAGDESPLIMPGSIPLDAIGVRDEITQYLNDQWKPIIDADIDGAGSVPQRIDAERPLFGKRSLTRRIGRSVFLGSAPRLHTAHKGIERQRVFLGVAQPGDTVGNFGSSLQMLGDRATYFYADADTYWYDVQQSLSRRVRDQAEQLSIGDVWAEVVERLQRTEVSNPGDFSEVQVAPESSADVPEASGVRLVILDPRLVHANRSTSSSAYEFVEKLVNSRGSAQRERRNTVIALAADHQRQPELESAVRAHLAWRSVVERIDAESAFTHQQAAQARRRMDETNKAIGQRIAATFIWVLYPEQPDGSRPLTIVSRKVEGRGEALARTVSKRVVTDDILRTSTAPRNVRMDLDNHLRNRWNDGRIALGELWDYYTKYPYLPRMKDRAVLDRAVQDSLGDIGWETGGFAVADGYDEATGDFLGLVLPHSGRLSRLVDTTLLVAPHLAMAQHQRELSAVERRAQELVSEQRKADSGSVAEDTIRTKPVQEKPQVTRNARFIARFNVDPDSSIEEQLATVVREVLDRLHGGADTFDVTLDIEAERFDGFDDAVVRTVSENCRTIGFSRARFEDGQ
ncbi:Swt1 family HEPN domain-containing protein [Nocardia sp. NPDC050799]|uniref:Swt1 family HEPN domain-containing protein n=1 Tax=Nocardia sp. NPDC050799 TaxID=3154842 RepID=UPI0033CA1413